MPDADTAIAILQGALNSPPPPPAALSGGDPGPVIDVGGAAPLAPSPGLIGLPNISAVLGATAAPATSLQPDGTHHIMVNPNDAAYAQYAGSVMGVSDPRWLPKGITLPADTKYPVTIKFGALPSQQPQSFPVVDASTVPGLAKPPAASPAAAATPAPPAAPTNAAALPADDIDAKLSILNGALANPGAAPPTAKAATPSVPTTSPPVAPPSRDAYYDRATDSVIDPSANGANPQTGLLANTAAGGNAAAANTLGGPVDLVTGALNLGARGINAATGASIPTIQNPVGGSAWLQSAMGLIGADPRNVVPQTLPEQLARAASGGAVSAVLPMGPAGEFTQAANPVVAGVARTLTQAPIAAGISGATAGVGGALATDAAQVAGVPDSYLPYIDMAGQVAGGGVGALGTSAAMLAGKGVAAGARAMSFRSPDYMRGANGLPVTDATGATIPAVGTQKDFQAAGRSVAARAGMAPRALAGSIPTPDEAELVPGSQGTMGQVTGNQGLLGLERHLETKNRDPFRMRSAEQNAARRAYMATLSPIEAQAQGASEFVRARLDQIDRETEAERAQLKDAIRRHDAGLSGTEEPAQIGGRMAGQVNARLAPARAVAERAVGVAQGRVDAAAERMGGAAGTTREEEGAALRARLAGLDNQEAARVTRLYESIDPTGSLALSAQPLRDVAERLRMKLDPSAGDEVSEAEEKLLRLAERARPVVAFSWLQTFRENINEAIGKAKKNEDGKAVRRLTILKKQGVNASIVNAVEQAVREEAPAVLAGEHGPDDVMLGRLAGHAADTGAHSASGDIVVRLRSDVADRIEGTSGDAGKAGPAVGRATGTDDGRGISQASGMGAQRLPGQSGTGSQAAPGLRHAPGNPSVSRRPESFAQLLIRHGGIKDESGELAAMGITNKTHPTLVRAAGITHDRARELGIEHGFIPADNPNMPNRSSINDVRDLLAREASGERVFRPEDMVEHRAAEAYDRQAEHQAHSLEQARNSVLDTLDDLHGDAGWLPREWLETAARDVMMGRTPHEAIADAETGWAHEVIDADTMRRGLSPQIGMPGAVQEGLSIGAVGKHSTPNFSRQAAETYNAANEAHGARKETYHKGAVGEVLAPSKTGEGFALPDTAVVGTFWKGRDTSGKLDAAGRGAALVKALGSREAAVDAIGNYAARDLRAVAGTGGEFNSAKLQNWLTAHQEALSAFPELRQRFGTLAKAQQQLDALKAQRDAVEALNPIKPGATGADTMSKFVVSGPKGGEAIDAYMRHTGGTPEAVAALHDGLLYSMRRKASADGGLNLRGFEAWKRDYASALSRVPDLAAKLDDFAGAQQALEDAATKARAARDAYTFGAARHYLSPHGEVDPQAAASRLLGSATGPADAADLMRQMKGDPAALEGLRKGMADHLVSLSGRDEMRGAAFRKFVDENKTSRTLSNIFTPDQMGVIRSIAADIERSNRTVTANKIPGSPGTAADSHGVAPDAHDLAGPLGAEGVGELASHLLGMTGIGAVVTRLAALGGRSVLARAKQAGLARQDQIATQMLLHPEFGRAVLQAVRAKNPGPGFWNRIGGVAGNLALAGQTMPPVVPYREMQRQ